MTRYRNRRRRRAGTSRSARADGVRFEGVIEIELDKAADVVASLVPGEILQQQAKGLGDDGNPMAPYSDSYRRALTRAGRDGSVVDHRLTGGMLGSVGERSRQMDKKTALVRIGPDSGTSPQVSLGKGVAKQTGRRGPPHNQLAKWLARKRPWLGLGPRAVKRIAKALEKAGLLRSER